MMAILVSGFEPLSKPVGLIKEDTCTNLCTNLLHIHEQNYCLKELEIDGDVFQCLSTTLLLYLQKMA